MTDQIPSGDYKSSEFSNHLSLGKIADLSPNILYVLNIQDQKILYVNKRIQDLLGHDIDLIYSKGWEILRSIIHPDDYDRRINNLEKCKELSESDETSVEVRLKVTSQEWQWFRITDKIFELEQDGSVSRVIGTAQNIHSQKLYEVNLKEEHRKLKNVHAIGHIGSFERKLPGNLITYSEEFYHILGLEPKQGEIGVDEFISHVHPEDREAYKAAISHTHSTGEPLDMITRVVRADGTIRHVHRRAAIIYNQNGEPSKVYGTVQDVTERINVENEKRRVEWLMRSTEKVAGTGSYEFDLVTNKIYLSDGLYHLLDTEPGSIEPTPQWLDSISHPVDAAEVTKILERAILTKQPYNYTRRIYRKNGEVRILETQGNIITNEEGNAVKTIGLVQDVTDRKKREEELRLSEQRSRNLLNVLQNAPDAYLILSPDLNIEMASDAYLQATGAVRDHIIGKYVFDIFPDNPEVENASGTKNLQTSFEQVLSSKKPHRMAIQNYDVPKLGGGFEEKYWSPVNTPVINLHGELEYIIHRILDVTEIIRKQDTVKGLTSKTEMLKNSLDEIKHQAAQIKESQNLLQSVFDASPSSIVLYKTLYDSTGKAEDFEFLMVNPYTFNLIGFRNAIIGKLISQEFPTAISSGVLEKLKNTADTGEQTDFEAWYDGEGVKKWFHWRANRIHGNIIVTTEDITERKRSRETLQQMLNGSLTAITILESERDQNGKIIDFIFRGGNKAAEALNLISTEELIGKRLLDLFPGVREHFFNIYVKVVEEGGQSRTQRHYQHEHFDHWLDVSAVKNGDGIILSYLDITELKRAEQELILLKDQLEQRANESEDRFRSLVTASSDTVYKMSPDWKLLYNLDGKNFLSDKNNASSSWLEEYVPKEEWPKLMEIIQESINTKTQFELEHQVIDINGNKGWIHSRAIPKLNEQGEIIEWLGAASNITARKKAEEQQAYLLQLSDGLRLIENPEEILITAASLLGRYLGASRVGYAEDRGDGKTISVTQNYTNGVSGMEGIYSYEDYGVEMLRKLQAGQTVIQEDIQGDSGLSASEKKAHAQLDLAATVNVPLIKKEKFLAVLFIHFNKIHHFTEEEIALIEETADRTWAALERAWAEKALREAQESLSIALEAAQMGTWVLDLTTNTTERNFRHDQIFGYRSPQKEWNIEVARKHVLIDDYPIFDAAFTGAEKSGKLHFEVRVRWPDESIHWMEVTGHYYFDQNGKPIRVAGVNFEVTERRKAEESLRESEQRFRNLVEASAMAVWETNPLGEVEVDSLSWRKFTGQSFEEWKGSGWLNVVHPNDLEFAKRKWNQAILNRENFDEEFRLRSVGGEYIWTNVKAIPIYNLGGEVTKWSGMNLDINNRKEVEEDLRKAKEEAEAASRAKEDFVSTMSHEIRTPLNAIIGLTNLLKHQNPRDDQKENLGSLSFSARNLLDLINDILDFSKLEAGKMEISENQFVLHDLLSNLQKAHNPQASSNRSEIVLDLEDQIPQIIIADQVKLSQILHNLVSNAVKFTKEGKVTIMVSLNREIDGIIWLDFAVKDNGIGIAADKAEHIFDKFTQAESSTVRNYGGTGLGLSITKLLLELLGSEIKVESRLGAGSSFYFTLPVKRGDKQIFIAEPEEIIEEIKDLSYLKILLVEDVEINRKIIMQFLKNWWLVEPDEATNGKEAVEIAKNRRYDLILMDIRMPEMDGYEATHLIRKLPGYEKTPILALTADINQEARHENQFDDMLTKPFEPRDLKEGILRHLSLQAFNKTFTNTEESAEEFFKPIKKPESISGNSINANSAEEPYEISRYEKISGGNEEVKRKLIQNAVKAFENYKSEFILAANEEDLKMLSNLVHKNTTSIHYVQANSLARMINEYRELLENPDLQRVELDHLKILIQSEFDKIIKGLGLY